MLVKKGQLKESMERQISKQKILVADDMSVSTKILAEALEQIYEVIIVDEKDKVLTTARSESPPDLILLDTQLQKVEGYDTCKKLKGSESTQNIPVIFISSVEDEIKGFEAGGVDYIIKPLNIPIVVARIKTHLNLKQKSDMLENLLSIDRLTNIPNKRRFEETLNMEVGRARRSKLPLSIIFIEVDFINTFYENYGYSAGDFCLDNIAKILEQTIRRPADFVARYGHEKFAAILPETELEQTLLLAGKIEENVKTLNIPHSHSQVSDVITLSQGITTSVPNDSLSPWDYIKAVDVALNNAKEQGHNQIKTAEVE